MASGMEAPFPLPEGGTGTQGHAGLSPAYAPAGPPWQEWSLRTAGLPRAQGKSQGVLGEDPQHIHKSPRGSPRGPTPARGAPPERVPPQEGYLPTGPHAVGLWSRVLVVSVTGKVVHTACGLGVSLWKWRVPGVADFHTHRK